MRRWPLAVVTALVVLGAAPRAWADDQADAARLFQEGLRLKDQQQWDDARATFARSYALDPAVGTQLNLADCLVHLDQPAEAWRMFEAAAARDTEAGNAARAKFGHEAAAKLLPQLVAIVVRVAEPGAPGLQLAIAGRDVPPAAEVHDVAAPGPITVEAKAPGRAPYRDTRTAGAGGSLAFDVALPAAAPPPPRVIRARVRTSRWRYLAYALGGVGAAALATGVGLGFKADRDYDAAFDHGCIAGTRPTCDDAGFRRQTDALRLADTGTYVGVGGGVLLVAGVVVFVVAPSHVVVAPTADATTVGLVARGRF